MIKTESAKIFKNPKFTPFIATVLSILSIANWINSNAYGTITALVGIAYLCMLYLDYKSKNPTKKEDKKEEKKDVEYTVINPQ